jgi:hypothetical protein
VSSDFSNLQIPYCRRKGLDVDDFDVIGISLSPHKAEAELSDGRDGADLQSKALLPLKIGNDLKQVAGRGISLEPKHLVKGLDVELRVLRKIGKTNCGVDVIA